MRATTRVLAPVSPLVIVALTVWGCDPPSTEVHGDREAAADAVAPIAVEEIEQHQVSWRRFNRNLLLEGFQPSTDAGDIDRAAARLRQLEFRVDNIREYLMLLLSDFIGDRATSAMHAREFSPEAFEAIRGPLFASAADPELAVRATTFRVFAERGTDAEKDIISHFRYSASKTIAQFAERVLANDDGEEAEHKLYNDVRQLQRITPPRRGLQTLAGVLNDRLLAEGQRHRAMQDIDAHIDKIKREQGDEPRLVRELLPYLYSVDWKVRRYAIAKLRDVPAKTFADVEQIAVGFLSDEHPFVIAAAIGTLAGQGSDAVKEILPHFRYAKITEVADAAKKASQRQKAAGDSNE